MRNAFITLLLAIGLISFLRFTNNNKKPVLLEDDDEYTQDDSVVIDTVPAKKDLKKTTSKISRYDSSATPKKTDSAWLK
jgi:hypothetical protein